VRSFRVTIAGLMALVLYVAVGFAALKTPSEAWATLTLLLLTLALLGSIFTRGGNRAFWGGFAIAGWSYWILSFGPWFDTHIGPRLATKSLADGLYHHLQYVPKVGGEKVWFEYNNDIMRGFVAINSRSPAGPNYTIIPLD